MPTLLQINSTANWGSTGKIAEQIGALAMQRGWESYIAYGRSCNASKSKLIKIGSKLGVYWHVLESRLFDNHGLASRYATKKFIKQIESIKPDIIHLHNIHGYYLNYKLLFEYLNKIDTPIVWTLHDCWSFTGHCAHYVKRGCEQWKSECIGCNCNKAYPKSITNRIRDNFKIKRNYFTSIRRKITITPVSKWLASQAKQSFLIYCDIQHIYNGIDISIFSPQTGNSVKRDYNIDGKFTIIGVASAWSDSKGLSEYYKLRERLSDRYAIIMVGLSQKQIDNLPSGIIGIKRTQSQQELAELYSAADVVLSLSRAETFGLTIAEGMACGTPAIVYNTTAIPELITPNTGIVVEKVGDLDGIIDAINEIRTNGKEHYSAACRKYAEEHFNKDICFDKYINLYEKLIKNR